MIRPFCMEDTDAVMEIWLSVNKIAHGFIEASYWTENFQAVEKTFLPRSETYVYEEDGQVRGFVSILPKWFVGALFVSLESQGNGIGTALLEFCKQRYERLSLGVFKENTASVGFYHKCGFDIILERESDCPPHMEYLMEWVRDSEHRIYPPHPAPQ